MLFWFWNTMHLPRMAMIQGTIRTIPLWIWRCLCGCGWLSHWCGARTSERPHTRCAACQVDTSAKGYRCQANECLKAGIDLCESCYPKKDSLILPKPHEKSHHMAYVDAAAAEKFGLELNRLCFCKGDLDQMRYQQRVDLINTDRNFGDYISNALDSGAIQVDLKYPAMEFFERVGCRAVVFEDKGPAARIVWDFNDIEHASWETAEVFAFEGLIRKQDTWFWYPFQDGRMPIDDNRNYNEYPDNLKLGFRGDMVTQEKIKTLASIRVAWVGPYEFGVYLS